MSITASLLVLIYTIGLLLAYICYLHQIANKTLYRNDIPLWILFIWPLFLLILPLILLFAAIIHLLSITENTYFKFEDRLINFLRKK